MKDGRKPSPSLCHVTVEKLTQKAGISQSYLYRVFREAYGQSPKQYLSAVRVHAALEALRTTDLSITEIGRQVGFKDVLVFSSFFSRATGYSPQAYRRKYR